MSELLRALHDLVRKTPDRTDLPQVATPPVRTQPGLPGYIILACPDCLRTFKVSTPANTAGELTAVCTHCEAQIPFLIESTQAA